MNWIQRLFKSKKIEQPINSELNKHNVIGSVCDHPNRQREYYHDGAYKCWECHKIIVAN
jgi:hypothetical protein